jgi:hypothetical protein
MYGFFKHEGLWWWYIVKITNFLDIILYPNLIKNMMFWRLESVSIFRQYLLCWAQLIELVQRRGQALSVEPNRVGFTWNAEKDSTLQKSCFQLKYEGG